ncbi:hypothetical protein SCUP234_03615 [Seiridium cupressi]
MKDENHATNGPRILLLATCDTKLEEITFIHHRLTSISSNIHPILMDIGRSPVADSIISIPQPKILSAHTSKADADLTSLPRDEYSTLMANAATLFTRQLQTESPLHGVLGIGGSTGSSIIASIMRDAIPIGLPKLLVSTMASGDVGPLVGGVDLTLMYSVTDIAGLTFLSERILGNAAAAMAGMAGAYLEAEGGQHVKDTKERKKRVAVTMFGVTTPGVDAIRSILSQPPHSAEVVVFHATGSGGRAMETLIQQGEFDAIIDLTTTEIADEVGGGILSAGPDRLLAGAQAGIPMIVSVGACDMVNFGPKETMKAGHLDAVDKGERKLYVHNPMVTLLRTTKEENRRIAEFIVGKLRRAQRKDLIRVVIPTGAVSMISGTGGPFEDREADEELFRGLENGLEGAGVDVVRFDGLGVNDNEFAKRVVEALVEVQGAPTK